MWGIELVHLTQSGLQVTGVEPTTFSAAAADAFDTVSFKTKQENKLKSEAAGNEHRSKKYCHKDKPKK